MVPLLTGPDAKGAKDVLLSLTGGRVHVSQLVIHRGAEAPSAPEICPIRATGRFATRTPRDTVPGGATHVTHPRR